MTTRRKNLFPFIMAIGVFMLFYLAGCKKSNLQVLKMATTTSTDNTGLLDYLKPAIESDTGIDLHWVAVGTGKALELGRNCDVDVLLVHAPAAEKKFVDEGHGVNRKELMYNDFIIIGPETDPGKLKGLSVTQAFKKIFASKITFASRGDDSGTNKKEISLWKAAGLAVPDKQSWYIQTGQGMMNTINIAAERDAYTMTDRGTYIKYQDTQKDKITLKVLVEGDESLFNQYSIITVNPAKCPDAKKELAAKLTKWFVSDKTQKRIGDFRLLNKKLFVPNASQ